MTSKEEEIMFGRKKGPDEPFGHADDCKIVAADPNVKIEWSEVRNGVWEAVCVCGKQYFYDPIADDRTRFDPLDPDTARHSPLCEFVSVTDPAVLRAVLRVTPKDGYSWVACNGCDYGWQVPHFASVG